MRIIEKIYISDLPHTKKEVDGYDLKDVPDLSSENLTVIINKINEIIDYIDMQHYKRMQE